MFKKLTNYIKAFGKTTAGLLLSGFVAIVAGATMFTIDGWMAKAILIAVGIGWVLTGLAHLMEGVIAYWDTDNDDDDEIDDGSLGFR